MRVRAVVETRGTQGPPEPQLIMLGESHVVPQIELRALYNARHVLQPLNALPNTSVFLGSGR